MPRLTQDQISGLGIDIDGLNYAELEGTIANFYIPTRENYQELTNAPSATRVILEAQATLSNGIVQARTMQATMGALTMDVGVPNIPGFESIFAALTSDITGTLAEALSEMASLVQDVILDALEEVLVDALGTAMEGLELAMDFISAIPIYGYIVNLVLGLVKAIVGMVQLIKQQEAAKREAMIQEFAFPAFNPKFDESMYNLQVLAKVRDTLDWTSIWTVPYAGPSQIFPDAYFGRTDIEGPGVYKYSGFYERATGSPGCTPGVGWCTQSLLLQDTYIGGIQYTMAWDEGQILYPSSRQQTGYLWKSLSRNDLQPALYCVDANQLYGGWRQYVEKWWEFLYNLDMSDEARWKVFRLYNGTSDVPGPFFGMNIFSPPTELAVEQVLVVKECKTLLDRQWAALDTTVVAYVQLGGPNNTNGMQAFNLGNGMRQKAVERRMDLLQHTARCGIVLGDVETSDPVYHQYLVESGAGSPACGPTQLAIETQAFNDAADLPKGFPGPGAVSQVPPPPPAEPEARKTWWQTWGPWLAGSAVLGGAAYLGYRHMTQRKSNGLYLPPSVG